MRKIKKQNNQIANNGVLRPDVGYRNVASIFFGGYNLSLQYRRSSAEGGPTWFYEYTIWEFGQGGSVGRGDLVFSDEVRASNDSEAYLLVCDLLLERV